MSPRYAANHMSVAIVTLLAQAITHWLWFTNLCFISSSKQSLMHYAAIVTDVEDSRMTVKRTVIKERLTSCGDLV